MNKFNETIMFWLTDPSRTRFHRLCRAGAILTAFACLGKALYLAHTGQSIRF